LAGPLPRVDSPLGPSALGVALIVLLGLYVAAIAAAPRLGTRRVVVSIVAAHAVLLLGPPLLSADVFGYIGYGRLGALYGISPYVHGAAALGDDPVHGYILWRDSLSPYGPAFTLLSYAIALLGVAGALWAFKALAVAASLFCVAVVVRTAPQRGLEPARGAALVGLNPVLLVFAVGGAHNDLVIAALTAVTVSLLVRGSSARAAPAVLAGAMKASALLLVPFVLAAHPRRRALLPAGVIAAVLAIVAAAVFGGQLGGMTSAVADQQRAVATRSVPAEVAAMLGFHTLPAAIRVLAFAIFVGAIAALLRRAWRGADVVSAAGWATAALLVTTAWLLPWYLVWLLPLAALATDRRLELATLAVTTYLVATRVPFLLG
jgi:hypothetical protein